MNYWMFSCHEVSRKISQSMDARLTLLQRMGIRIHLMMCRYCARFRRQLTLLRTICRIDEPDQPTEGQGESLSAEAKMRIKEKLIATL